MRPEQIMAKKVDTRTDIFALGAVLWEMLCMQRLFQGENEVETIQIVRACEIDRDISVLNPEVDDDLKCILLRSLQKNPDSRYISAAAFEKDLRKYLNKHHSNFAPSDLGSFTQRLLPERYIGNKESIKKLLSQQVEVEVEKKDNTLYSENIQIAAAHIKKELEYKKNDRLNSEFKKERKTLKGLKKTISKFIKKSFNITLISFGVS